VLNHVLAVVRCQSVRPSEISAIPAAPARLTMLTRSVAIDAAAIVIAFAWFIYAQMRPDAYNGRVCCDSVDYRNLALSINSISDLIATYDYRAIGYPAFLRVHLLAQQVLGLPQPDWISLSLATAFALFVISMYALYSSLRARGIGVPRQVLWLLLLDPALGAYAGIPITDSLALSLVALGFACLLRLRWRLGIHDIALALLAGLLLGLLALTRPPHYVPSLALMAAFLLIAAVLACAQRSPALIILPLSMILAFAALTGPRHIACAAANGGNLCFLSDQDVQDNLRLSLTYERQGFKTYGLLWTTPDGVFHNAMVTVPDGFARRYFSCLQADDGSSLTAAVVSCYRDRALLVPIFFAKKSVALFDNSHLDAYAAFITPTWMSWWNRLFGMLGFAGFWCLVAVVAVATVRRRLPLPTVLPLLYLGVYLAATLVPHIEARFGFPLLPPAFIALGLVCQKAANYTGRTRLIVAAALVCLCAAFLAQVLVWDWHDPLLTGSFAQFERRT
jgi:hypothetical protein